MRHAEFSAQDIADAMHSRPSARAVAASFSNRSSFVPECCRDIFCVGSGLDFGQKGRAKGRS